MVEQLLEFRGLQEKVEKFPESYLEDFSGELDQIDYEWQTNRWPVKDRIQQRTDGAYAIEAGRTDSITSPLLRNELRANYVYNTVNGQNVKQGTEVVIPIPRGDSAIEELTEELETDEQQLSEQSQGCLREDIDDTVYELFNLSQE